MEQLEYIIVAISKNGSVIEYPQMMKAFGDDLELAAEWCYNVNLPDRCPMEFTLATVV